MQSNGEEPSEEAPEREHYLRAPELEFGRRARYQYRDAAKMKENLSHVEDLDWTLVGLPRLTSGKATGRYRSSVVTPLHHPSTICRADLATYLVSIINEPSTYRQWTEVSQ